MKRSDIHPMPEYFDRYINQVDDIELADALQQSILEIEQFPLDRWRALGDTVYAPGKWTVRDILQHLIDTERVFAYRALSFARGETARLPSYDEDTFAQSALANRRELEDLVAELLLSRRSFEAMYRSFDPEMLQRTGLSFKGTYSVLSIGFVIPGHQRHHLNILEERYYPLL
ncbi:MAG: DinB family protein [Saprospiraceae bacterium]|nr:DinB family protein [Saprospiraceae bacterium]